MQIKSRLAHQINKTNPIGLVLFVFSEDRDLNRMKYRCPVDICLFFHKERTSLRMSFLIIYSSSGGVKADMIQRYLSREEVAFQVM